MTVGALQASAVFSPGSWETFRITGVRRRVCLSNTGRIEGFYRDPAEEPSEKAATPTLIQLLFISALAHRRLHLLDLTMTRSFYERHSCYAKREGRNQFTDTSRV
jgi:hypothetical protein